MPDGSPKSFPGFWKWMFWMKHEGRTMAEQENIREALKEIERKKLRILLLFRKLSWPAFAGLIATIMMANFAPEPESVWVIVFAGSQAPAWKPAL